MRPFKERHLLPQPSPGLAIAISLALMIIAIGTSVALFARSQDERQIVSEQKIVTSAINDAMIKLGNGLRPNTYWDAAYDHLTDRVDARWAENNLGPYARDTSGVSVLLIVPERGGAFYRFVGKEPDQNAMDYEGNAAVRKLVHEAMLKTAVPPVIATGFVRVGDSIYLGAASKIVPNDERAKQPLQRRNIEVYLQIFGAERITEVQRDFHLSRASLSVAPPPHGKAHINLRDAAGASVGYLWWQAATPGESFAVSIAPFAIFVVATIGFLLWLVLRGWASTVKDLERKKMEAALLRHESQAKSAFIGNISHELRKPLNAILGFSEIFMKQMFGPLGSANYCEYAAHIHSSGTSLLQKINDVIEISRIEGGEKKLDYEAVNAIVLVKDAMQDVASAAAAKGVALVLSATGENLEMWTSSPAMHGILVRLLDNAIKFSYLDSQIEILVESRDGISIQICDHGIGIQSGLIDSLGKPFSQVNRHRGGLGLGLAISYGLARLLDISISLESTLDTGTVVTLRIPQLPAAGDKRGAA